MPGRILPRDIEEVKARVNIADVVADYVTLKPAGVGSLKGLCPFHDERTPSFHVRSQVGFYHCFGCGESGDVYSFLQKMDHVTFAEAVERLAGGIGYQLHYTGEAAETDHGNRARLLAANRAAEEFFVEQLARPAAEEGRRFLGSRGFDAEAADRFGVGFAPAGWDVLTGHLRSKGFTPEELAAAGLVSTGARGAYDRFRGRLVWPIRDLTGQTVGFGARRLFDDDKGPKYLNTPETPVFHKAQVLYGLDLAKRDISRRGQVVIVEGYTDVMALHLAGITTAVATCGTAFGSDHVPVLRRILGDSSGLGDVIFTFDPDAAGQKAALRAFSQEKRFAAATSVAVPPEGLDPCDLRLKRGDEALRRLIEAKKPLFEFVIRQALSHYDLDTVEGRVAALREAAPVVAEIRDPALRPGYTRELARMLGMDLGEVSRAVASAHSTPRERGSQPSDAESGDPVDDRGARLMDLPTDPATRLERDALMVMLQHPDLVGADLMRRASQTRFANQSLAVVRDGVAAGMAASLGAAPEASQPSPANWSARVVDEVPEPFAALVRQLAVAPIPERDGRELTVYARSIAARLIERDLLARKAELVGRLQRADATDREASAAIQRELVQVEADRRALREE